MRKTDKLCKQIQRIASHIILYELNDPRIAFVTVTKIKLSEDFQYCTIYISILGTEVQQRTTMRGLKDARGFIQKQLASRLSLRTAPLVTIEQDRSIEKSFEMFQRLEEDRKKQRQEGGYGEDEKEEHGGDEAVEKEYGEVDDGEYCDEDGYEDEEEDDWEYDHEEE